MGFVLTEKDFRYRTPSIPASWYDADVLMVKWQTDSTRNCLRSQLRANRRSIRRPIVA